MLRMTRKTLLALEAVLDIAYNARPEPVQAKEITRRQGVPQRYLEQVMQQLVHEGILKGVRGPRGGYTLARERRRITVGEVVRAIATFEANEEQEPVSSAALGTEIIAPLWAEAEGLLLAHLNGVTLEDLCRKAEAQHVPHAGRERPDFAI